MMYSYLVAIMTLSEARAALPALLNRVAAGEEITITRHGSPAAVLVRPDIIWGAPSPRADTEETREVVRLVREQARRHGRSLRQELDAILDEAEASTAAPLPPIRLVTVHTAPNATWDREEIYGDEGR
jgi:antitoxin (DNA-binding transcriptional repressor) of toxin-antitoxin stability system